MSDMRNGNFPICPFRVEDQETIRSLILAHLTAHVERVTPNEYCAADERVFGCAGEKVPCTVKRVECHGLQR